MSLTASKGEKKGSYSRQLTLLIPAGWLLLQATILVVALAVFTFRPGLLAERFPAFMAGLFIAAVFATVARALAQGRGAGHIAAVLIFVFEGVAFVASLVSGRGGAWAGIQLGFAVAMLVLLFVRPTRDEVSRVRAERALVD